MYEFGFNTKIGKKHVEGEYLDIIAREGGRDSG